MMTRLSFFLILSATAGLERPLIPVMPPVSAAVAPRNERRVNVVCATDPQNFMRFFEGMADPYMFV